mmetsp:Transcript_14322/g.36539  ORF Transcript_14322/g.36539 Transcript_14322/m.36539 type:complete len:86 (+) Transcript_14322:1911-2168(+)
MGIIVGMGYRRVESSKNRSHGVSIHVVYIHVVFGKEGNTREPKKFLYARGKREEVPPFFFLPERIAYKRMSFFSVVSVKTKSKYL